MDPSTDEVLAKLKTVQCPWCKEADRLEIQEGFFRNPTPKEGVVYRCFRCQISCSCCKMSGPAEDNPRTALSKFLLFSGPDQKISSWHLLMIDAAPKDCVPCRFCHSKEEMYLEWPKYGDWYGQGFVCRIGCLCDASADCEEEGNDEQRTGFLVPDAAIKQWNQMQVVSSQGDGA